MLWQKLVAESLMTSSGFILASFGPAVLVLLTLADKELLLLAIVAMTLPLGSLLVGIGRSTHQS